jgi:DNA-binding HxlR family transcriptional regulator
VQTLGQNGEVSDYDMFLADCPARTTLELISDTWSVVVLVGLAHGPRRYTWLLERVGGISKKMLTQTLRKLSESGLVARPPARGGDYALTALGESLLGPLTALTDWAEQHTDDLAAVNG